MLLRFISILIIITLPRFAYCLTEVVDGITWTYTVSNGKATVGGGSSSSPAIATSTSGAITVPTILGGVPVTGIAQYAFNNCANLVKVVIPNGITHIDQYAFSGCGALEEITLPESLKTIGYRGFKYCYALRRVDVASIASWCNIEFDSPASQPFCDGTADCMLYIDGIPQMEIVIPDGVKRINNYAFRLYQKLTHISIPGSVTNIGTAAFLECSGLKSVTLPQIICNSGFAATFPNSCASVTNIVLSDGVTDICDSSFAGCSGLTSIVIPEGVTNIGNSAFRDCIGLVSLVVPDSVVSIGQYAFQGCISLSEVDIPSSVQIGNKAFDGCPAEENITYTDVASRIRNVTAKQRYPWNGKVDITFEVVGDVTAGLPEWNMPHLAVTAKDCLTGVKYEASKAALSGDTGTTEGMHNVVWDLNVQGLQIKSDDVVFNIAYKTMFDAQVVFCVIDLSGGASASSYPVSYLADVPSGGWTDEYKTTKLVLRLIEPGSFKMRGSYDVTLTKPFYCGVFEVTQRQWELVTGSNPCSSTSYGKGNSHPVHYVSYNMIRGSSTGSGWPASSAVDSSSFLGKLRARAGLDFDLPTEAQWEYACRAGTTTTYSYGNSANGSYMWYGSNSGSLSHEVGTKLPNPWGLYDMHGNVWEWCLDWVASSLTGGTDPKGSSSGSHRVIRGGCWSSDANRCASSYRDNFSPSLVNSNLGFRLVRTLSN